MVRVDVLLRTQQMAYLRGLADREDVSISRAFGLLIEARTPSHQESRALGKKRRIHAVLHPDHLAVLDRMAIETGLSRSEVARRLIDDAARGG